MVEMSGLFLVTPFGHPFHHRSARTSWQLAASAVVVVPAALALVVSPPLGPHRGGHADGPHRDDEILRSTLLIAGVIGVVIAAVVGFLIARRAVAPLGDASAG